MEDKKAPSIALSTLCSEQLKLLQKPAKFPTRAEKVENLLRSKGAIQSLLCSLEAQRIHTELAIGNVSRLLDVIERDLALAVASDQPAPDTTS